MLTTLMIVHGVLAVFMIVMVLIQFGKGAEQGLMTSGASDEILSTSKQGDILGKITTVLAILFLSNSILLAKLQSTNVNKSIMDTHVTTPVAPVQATETKETAVPVEAPVPTTK